jgi:peptidoglycan/LPS O-acetylase OafA/YrhL
VVLAFACRRLPPRRGLACVVLSAIVVGLAILCGTRLDQYRGLSGIDSALFAMVATSCLIDSRAAGERGRTAGFAVLLLALAGKLAYECLTGQALFVNADATGIPPVPLAHAAGAATGVLMAVIRPCRPSHRSSPHGCPGVHVVVRH